MRKGTLGHWGLICLLAAGAVQAGVPPSGFEETVVLSAIFQITGFDWASNGDLWIISKPGLVRIMRPGEAQPTILRRLSVDPNGERGLLGLAIDPNYATNRFVYFYYTSDTTPPRNRVSRFTLVGSTLQNDTLLLEGPPLVSVLHNAGALCFGQDGMLYIAMGDNAQPSMAQNRGSLLGKILRIAPDGSVPASNPYFSDPNARPEVWAYGFRNPYRFSVDPVTGTLFIGDVGDSLWEELDLGVAGANYGWPTVEGPEPPGVPGITYPVLAYPHLGSGASIIAGDHMVAGNFPPEYLGNYFYADFTLWKIFRLILDGSNQVVLNEPFVTSAVAPVHVRVGPDGALYYASIQFETLYRVAFVGGANRTPKAVAAASPDSGLAPLGVQFDATGSTDPDGDPLSFTWTFGDGANATGPTPFHVYASPGVFQARLDASDGQAVGSGTVRIVSGNRKPAATIDFPADGSRFDAGQTIAFGGSAFDPEEGALGAGAFSWTVLFHHNTHTHPYLGPLGGIAQGNLRTEDVGETSPDVWYEIRFTATDSGSPLGSAGALSDTRSVAILPNLSTMTFATSPRPDLTLKLDGAPFAAPKIVTGVVGVQRTIEALTPQMPGDGRTYAFAGWSNGGAPLQTIATPAADTTFTATFSCNVLAEASNLLVTLEPTGKVTLAWEAPPDPCLAAGPARFHVYAGASAAPLSAGGSFPVDPPFVLRGAAGPPTLTFTPSPGTEFYLVVPVGSDGSEGPVGHYGK